MNANQRFKRTSRRYWWLGGLAAVGIHAIILLFVPPFEIVGLGRDRVRPRMVVTVGAWRAPVCRVQCGPAGARYDTIIAPPEIRNWGEVNYRLPRIYPRTLWTHREPTSATLEVRLDPDGRVQEAVILESGDNGTDRALLELARMLRFSLPDAYDRMGGMSGRFELAIAAPL